MCIKWPHIGLHMDIDPVHMYNNRIKHGTLVVCTLMNNIFHACLECRHRDHRALVCTSLALILLITLSIVIYVYQEGPFCNISDYCQYNYYTCTYRCLILFKNIRGNLYYCQIITDNKIPKVREIFLTCQP